ncbi:MAG: hypothetical protein JWO38_707 [Gemmataceae bacterium]|nr:hypothetical protein [Gemmataceae bacterium]
MTTVGTTAHQPAAPVGRGPVWVWPWRPGGQVGRVVLRWAGAADPLTFGRWWPAAAAAVGAVPILLGYAAGSALHQPATAVLITPLFLACLARDRLGRAVGVVALVFGAHSAVAIVLSARDPAGAAAVLPGSEAYWQRTWLWVSTGEDLEYRWAEWLPAHALLLLVVPLGAYTSFGTVPLATGLEQVDLMNYYVGRLAAVSESPAGAVLFGWHPWSVLRGLAYTVLVFEVASWSLERLSGRPLSTRRRRARRWVCGIGLALLDGAAKFALSPVIRDQLFANLLPGVA